jgi:hypothetical protein
VSTSTCGWCIGKIFCDKCIRQIKHYDKVWICGCSCNVELNSNKDTNDEKDEGDRDGN